jgi:hypothetical protein
MSTGLKPDGAFGPYIGVKEEINRHLEKARSLLKLLQIFRAEIMLAGPGLPSRLRSAGIIAGNIKDVPLPHLVTEPMPP